MMNTEIIRTTEGFAALKEEWDELLRHSASNSLFLTWEWLYTWWRHLGGDRRLHIVTVRDGEQLVGVAPLVERPCRLLRLIPFRAMEFLGSGEVGSDYLSLLIRKGYEGEALDAIAGSLNKRRLMLELNQIEKSSMAMVNLALQLSKLGWRTTRLTSDYCPYIVLAGQDWDSYLEGLHRSHRNYFRKKLRKIHKNVADVRLEQAVTDAQRRQALENLIALHLKCWRQRGGSNALEDPALQDFHREFTGLALDKGWLRLYTLFLDGEPAACMYGFKYNEVFYYYQAGFDPDYGKFSTGLVTLGLSIKNAIEDGAVEFDFLHGDEDYKYLWAREERELVRLDMFPPHLLGELSKQTMLLRCGLKRMIWRLCPTSLSDLLTSGRRIELHRKPGSSNSGGAYATRTD